MNDQVARLTLNLIGPGTLGVFGIAFLWVWFLEEGRHHLLLIAGACFLFVLGALAQIFRLPYDTGANAILSTVLYTTAVIAAAEGILGRSGRQFGLLVDLLLLAIFTSLIAYYFYWERNLLARVYIQNFGFGLVLLLTALRLTHLARGRYVDRALFWVLLIFAIQFFPRTILTIGATAPVGESAFSRSFFWQALQLSVAVLGAGLALAILAATIADLVDDLRRERDVDILTGVLNRRGFDARAKALLDQGRSLELVLCDLDHFKKINDDYGHDIGDGVLQAFGSVLQSATREIDVVGRVGGEEFAILLPAVDLVDAKQYVHRLRLQIDRETFPLPAGACKPTVSMGVAMSRVGDTLESLTKRADVALYQAKNDGRNRVVFIDAPRITELGNV